MHSINLIHFIICICAYLFTSQLAALDLKPSEIRTNSKAKPASVLQNRYFIKSFRPEFGLSAGSMLNESYTDTYLMGVRAALFINEFLGIEFQSNKTSVKDSDDRKALNQLRYRRLDDIDTIVSPDPEINSIKSMTDINAVFAPFYGKINILDRLIIYSDIYLTGGVSKVETSQGSLNALTWGAGQRYYWGKNIAFRIDVKDRVFTEKRSGKDYVKHSYGLDFGVSYFIL